LLPADLVEAARRAGVRDERVLAHFVRLYGRHGFAP
jgi:hypothetical protein